MNQEEMLLYLKPIWEARGWNYKSLCKKPYYQIKGIYLTYKNKSDKVEEMIHNGKKKAKQLSLF
ncbi:MAG: hypothetical protein ACOCP8_00270 [archaeon]